MFFLLVIARNKIRIALLTHTREKKINVVSHGKLKIIILLKRRMKMKQTLKEKLNSKILNNLRTKNIFNP